jgi:thiamine biosynthesis lipoprotein
MTGHAAPGWLRRARPLLGTLVEVGVDCAGCDTQSAQRAADAAFEAIAQVQARLSRFESGSDIAAFHALPVGASLAVDRITQEVLAAAHALQTATDGCFDISLGSAPQGWRCAQGRLHKLDAAVRLDLGGIGKGHAVDCAVAVLAAHGCTAGWVNAGGDLRAFGAVAVPVRLRDEMQGGVRAFASLSDGAFATSDFAPGSRAQAAGGPGAAPVHAHASVAAPLCLWADALTKLVALSGNAQHPVLDRYGACAWLH